MSCRAPVVLLLIFLSAGGASAQPRQRLSAAVSYVSSGTVYLQAGRGRGLAEGDTLIVVRESRAIGVVVVTATSTSSSSAGIVTQREQIVVGDSAWIEKIVPGAESPPAALPRGRTRGTLPRPESSVSGRVALQYAGAGGSSSYSTMGMPAVVFRLDAGHLAGSDLRLTINGRTSTDIVQSNSAEFHKIRVRMYELNVSTPGYDRWYGFSLGRFFSPFAGGIGPVDGAEFYLRAGKFTFGMLGGSQPDYATSRVDTRLQKLAAYTNFRWGGEAFAASSVTLAYGQLLNAGNPDRDYLYFQAMLRPADGFFVSGSTEFDLHVMESGERVRKLRLTNTFVTLMYTPPFQWLSVSAGYDAARSIYLFESMKLFPDSLMDRTLREGFRGSVSLSLPARITLTGNGSFRLKTSTTGAARTLSGGIRVADIFQSGIGTGASVSDIRGLYTSGIQYTIDCDLWLPGGSGATLRFDRYRYQVQGSQEDLVASTLGISFSQTLVHTLFAALSYDRIWEQESRSWRLYAELGIHF